MNRKERKQQRERMNETIKIHTGLFSTVDVDASMVVKAMADKDTLFGELRKDFRECDEARRKVMKERDLALKDCSHLQDTRREIGEEHDAKVEELAVVIARKNEELEKARQDSDVTFGLLHERMAECTRLRDEKRELRERAEGLDRRVRGMLDVCRGGDVRYAEIERALEQERGQIAEREQQAFAVLEGRGIELSEYSLNYPEEQRRLAAQLRDALRGLALDPVVSRDRRGNVHVSKGPELMGALTEDHTHEDEPPPAGVPCPPGMLDGGPNSPSPVTVRVTDASGRSAGGFCVQLGTEPTEFVAQVRVAFEAAMRRFNAKKAVPKVDPRDRELSGDGEC